MNNIAIVLGKNVTSSSLLFFVSSPLLFIRRKNFRWYVKILIRLKSSLCMVISQCRCNMPHNKFDPVRFHDKTTNRPVLCMLPPPTFQKWAINRFRRSSAGSTSIVKCFGYGWAKYRTVRSALFIEMKSRRPIHLRAAK